MVERLRVETIYCAKCRQRRLIDQKVDGIIYCKCGNVQAAEVTKQVSSERPWQPYLERENMIIWRREERPGLYAYKSKEKQSIF